MTRQVELLERIAAALEDHRVSCAVLALHYRFVIANSSQAEEGEESASPASAD